MPTFKIWNAGKDIRKTVQADSVAELCKKGAEKLGLQEPLRVVLETDGTEIDDDLVLLDPRGLCSGKNVVLILLQNDEHWGKKLTKPKAPMKSLSGAEHLVSIISQHSMKLRNFIDPDFGFLEELLKRGLLSEESYANVQKGNTYYQKNDSLIRYMKLKTKEGELHDFLDALRNTHQSHVANYLLANGEHLEMCYGYERPLNDEEMCRLRVNGTFLLSNVIVNDELLAALVSSECITVEHQALIVAQCTDVKKIVELMSIMRRRSAAALRKFVHGLRETKQGIVADVLSKPGVSVPVHVNVTSVRQTRDLKIIEEDLAVRLMEFYKALTEGTGDRERHRKHYEEIKDLWLEMELNGIRYLSSLRGNSVAVFLWCRDGTSMSHLCKMQKSGRLEFLLVETMNLLVDEDDDDRLSFSLKVIDQEWNLAKCYFQVSESCKLTESVKPSPFTKLPKELLEMILMKSLLSFYNSTWKLFPFTDFDPYSAMSCVCHSWQELITKRQWFKDTVKSYLSKNKIIQRNSVLDILPKEVVEMILMRSLLSAVHIPWRNSSSSTPHLTILTMASVCRQWCNFLSGRSWFASTLKSYLKHNKHIAILQSRPSVFYQCLDIDFFFLYEMHRYGLLSDERLLEIGSESDRQKQIERLHVDVFLKFSAENYSRFLEVLKSTGQSHISYYLEANGVINPAEHDERPLSDNENARIDAVRPRLADFIPSDEFLNALASHNCITKNQVDVILNLPDELKTSELLEFARRRSYAALRQLAAHLRKIDQYASAAEILTTDVDSAEPNVCDSTEPKVCDQVKSLHPVEKSKEYDATAVERAFAGQLIKIGNVIESGGTITIQNLNEIRSFWMLLERIQTVQRSVEDETETYRIQNISLSSECLISDFTSDDDEATRLQWTQNDCTEISTSFYQEDSINSWCDNICHKGYSSDMKKSQSYTCRRPIYREIVNCVLKMFTEYYHLEMQNEQNEKTHGLKTDVETDRNKKKGTPILNFSSKLDPMLLKKFQRAVSQLPLEKEFCQNLSDIVEVIYKRSKSAENFLQPDDR